MIVVLQIMPSVPIGKLIVRIFIQTKAAINSNESLEFTLLVENSNTMGYHKSPHKSFSKTERYVVSKSIFSTNFAENRGI